MPVTMKAVTPPVHSSTFFFTDFFGLALRREAALPPAAWRAAARPPAALRTAARPAGFPPSAASFPAPSLGVPPPSGRRLRCRGTSPCGVAGRRPAGDAAPPDGEDGLGEGDGRAAGVDGRSL
ncbi:hypothetical protein GCM10023079_14870 [Streptomyces chitinivorans]